MKRNLAVIIPCYNEGARLQPKAFIDFVSIHEKIDIHFVNDGSTDETETIIKDMVGHSDGQIRLLSLPENIGKAETVRQGVLSAIDMGYDCCAYFDADLAAPLSVIADMFEKIQGNISFVIGSRVKMLGYNIDRVPARHYLGRVFATCANLVLDLPIYDTQCGAKVFINNDEMKKAFSIPFSVNWTFDVELIARIMLIKKLHGHQSIELTAVEHPLSEWIHKDGSKIKPADFFIGLIELVRVFKLTRSKAYIESFKKLLP